MIMMPLSVATVRWAFLLATFLAVASDLTPTARAEENLLCLYECRVDDGSPIFTAGACIDPDQDMCAPAETQIYCDEAAGTITDAPYTRPSERVQLMNGHACYDYLNVTTSEAVSLSDRVAGWKKAWAETHPKVELSGLASASMSTAGSKQDEVDFSAVVLRTAKNVLDSDVCLASDTQCVCSAFASINGDACDCPDC